MSIQILVPQQEEVLVKPTDIWNILNQELYLDILEERTSFGKAYELISRGLGCLEGYFLGDMHAKWFTPERCTLPIRGKYILEGHGMNDYRRDRPTRFVGEVHSYNPRDIEKCVDYVKSL